MVLFRSLRHRSFALLWIGQTISRLGDSLYQIALAWWVLEHTKSAVALSMVFVCSFVPMLLFVLFGGVAVDRFSKAHLMLLSDLSRGVIVLLIAGLAASDRLAIWHIYLASIVFGAVDALFQPAYTAIVPEVTPSEVLHSANSLTSLGSQASRILGPALGALIVGLGGVPLAFIIDAGSFFISALCIFSIPPIIAQKSQQHQTSSIFKEMREGLSTVMRVPWLWIGIVLASLGNLTQKGPVTVGLPVLIKDGLGADVSALGLTYSMFAIGSLFSAVWLGRQAQLRHRGLLAYSAWAVLGLATLAQGISPSPIGVAVAALVSGVCLVLFGLIWTHTLQQLVPRELLGRVASIDEFGSFILLPVGFALAGWAIDYVGASMVLVIGGMLTAGLALLGMLHPAVRGLD